MKLNTKFDQLEIFININIITNAVQFPALKYLVIYNREIFYSPYQF